MARMFTGAGSIYADPAFQMGMALGNAYGNLWAHNAKERQKVKEEGIYNEMFGSNNDSNEIAQIAEMGSAGAQDDQGPRALRGIPAEQGENFGQVKKKAGLLKGTPVLNEKTAQDDKKRRCWVNDPTPFIWIKH